MDTGLRQNPFLTRTADCLGLNLTLKDTGLVLGGTTKSRDFGFGEMKQTISVVSSVCLDDFVSLIVHVAGNLNLVTMLGASTNNTPCIVMVDEGLLKHSLSGLFESIVPRNQKEVAHILQKGVVAAYIQKLGVWELTWQAGKTENVPATA